MQITLFSWVMVFISYHKEVLRILHNFLHLLKPPKKWQMPIIVSPCATFNFIALVVCVLLVLA